LAVENFQRFTLHAYVISQSSTWDYCFVIVAEPPNTKKDNASIQSHIYVVNLLTQSELYNGGSRQVERNCCLWRNQDREFSSPLIHWPQTGVELSKILGGLTKILGAKSGNKWSMHAWAFLNYWGHVHGLPPKVYAYAND